MSKQKRQKKKSTDENIESQDFERVKMSKKL